MKRLNSYNQHIFFNLLLQTQLKKHRQEEGYILVVVMGMILAISTMLITWALTSKVDTSSVKSSGQSAAGFYGAEKGLNLRAKDIRSTFVGYNVPQGTSPSDWAACRNGGGQGTGDFACDNSQTYQDPLNPAKQLPLSTFVIDQNPRDQSGNPIPTSVTINYGELFGGLNAQEYRYDVTSVAFDSNNQPTASLQMRFKSRLVPLFQFAAFYENDMDFTRPARMLMNGPIHSNHNLYLNASAPVSIYGQVSSAGRMYRGEKASGETCNSGLSIHDPYLNDGTATADNLVAMACNGTPKSEITTDTSYNNVYVGGTLANNWNGQIRPQIPYLTVPDSSLLDAKLPTGSVSYDYWNRADLRVALRLNNDSAEAPASIEVVNTDKSTNTAATNALNSSTCLPVSTTLTGSNYTTSSTNITVTNATNFNVGDPIRIVGSGIDDFDENVILSKSGNTLTLARPLGRQAIANSSGVTVSRAIVWSSETFYNYREKTQANQSWTLAQQGQLIRMLNVDVRGLLSCSGSLMGGKTLADRTDGGLVWHLTVLGPRSEVDVTKTTPDAPNNYGIRIYNGATLASNNNADPVIAGLTIASDQAMYVRGDYNTTNKKPAAILADSMNVLSNSSNLDDRRTCTGYSAIYNAATCNQTSGTALSSRLAANTSINAAFLAGVDITGGVNGEPNDGKSSGGLNNYTRLHEDWSNTNSYTFTYRGSMVSLGEARRVNGPFGNVGNTYNVYFAPTRNWDYDTDFNNAANLPPLTPRFVYLRQERFSRDYNRTSFVPIPKVLTSWLPNSFLSSILPAILTPRIHF